MFPGQVKSVLGANSFDQRGSENIVFGLCRGPAARRTGMLSPRTSDTSRTVEPAIGIDFVLGNVRVAVHIYFRSVRFRLDAVCRVFVSRISLFRRVYIDRLPVESSDAVKEPFRIFLTASRHCRKKSTKIIDTTIISIGTDILRIEVTESG